MKYCVVLFSLLTLLITLEGCKKITSTPDYKSDLLTISQVADGVYIHTSYLATEEYGNVPCNGMIVINDGDAIVCDTPTDELAAQELIEWISKVANASVNAVVVTHFHIDCLGGLASFHDLNIPSYANELTISLAIDRGVVIPQNGFETKLELPLGSTHLISAFHGAGHTKDNIVSYYEAEQALFGGCLVKTIGAGKGNLNDADVGMWSSTVRDIKKEYPNVEIVIPGHGSVGDIELLDYTIALFD